MKETVDDEVVQVDRIMLHKFLSKMRISREYIRVELNELKQGLGNKKAYLDEILETITLLEDILR